MAILAGIDEAGLGPLVGPLVVSASVFSVPDEMLDQCLWRVLAGAVTRRGLRKTSLLPIADSKQVYNSGAGLANLERGVLGMLRQVSEIPASLTGYLRVLAPRAVAPMQTYPWYAAGDSPLPRQADAQDIGLRANALAATLAQTGVRLEAMRAEPVFEGDFNRLLRATQNKAVAHFGVVSRLIAWIFETYAQRGPLRLVVDRLGGRMYYLHELQRIFSGAAIKILQETPQQCRYAVRDGDRQMEIWFCVEGEGVSLPVALASMISKYTRELFMELLNGWWAARVAGLKPTAGYYTDGHRFLRDIRPAMDAAGIDPDMLVRLR